ncbi:hypothetical protein [Thiorhodococcus fuscus]|uniref:Chromosome partitioning protein ParB n=1 Tax=Thiorhodococcus fuscus TaxID=527200 RepID=A0ABW4YEK8_9GAMM
MTRTPPDLANLGTRLILAASLIGAPSAFAASACKGLERPACEGKMDCRWVEGYEKQNGSQVSGYCRSSQKKTHNSNQSTNNAPSSKTKQ